MTTKTIEGSFNPGVRKTPGKKPAAKIIVAEDINFYLLDRTIQNRPENEDFIRGFCECIDKPQPVGSVRKVSTVKHLSFVVVA